jgi:hypothetical protein
MKCPHCAVAVFSEVGSTGIGGDAVSYWVLHKQDCPNCRRVILSVTEHGKRTKALLPDPSGEILSRQTITPRVINRGPIPPEVSAEFADDYRQACLVLGDSPKASAALSRRCLQHIIREKAGITRKTLDREIQDLLDTNTLPTHLAKAIDAVRQIGNFAAHPTKSESAGEILDVEPHEAEWNLDVIEEMFEFYFVQPEALKQRREAMNAKLLLAGKPELR